MRFLATVAGFFFSVAGLQAQPQGVVSSVKSEGIMVTSLAQPEFFIFQTATREEHFDGSSETMASQGGFEVGEPITDLHYLRPRLSVDGAAWSDEDKKLLATQFHGTSTGNFYLFKTVEGQLFYLPKEGQTPVIRVDYVLSDRRTITVWQLK